jgi:hypothetical protein
MLVPQSLWMVAAAAALVAQATSEPTALPVAVMLPQLAIQECALASKQQVFVYRNLTPLDGADVELTYEPSHDQCNIKLDATGAAAISVLLDTLSEEGWERLPTAESQWAVVNAMWRKNDRLMEVNGWRDAPDEDLSGSVFVTSVDGPSGHLRLSKRDRQLRPLSDALIVTVFDLCTRLVRGRDADYADMATIEPEAVFNGEVLADPTQGTIKMQGGEECNILVNGPAGPDAIEALAAAAQTRGLKRDADGALRGDDMAIRTEARDPIKLNWPSWAASDYPSVAILVRSSQRPD